MRPWAFAALLLAGCGSTRPLEVPPPFDYHGIRVTVKPRVYIDRPFPLESIRGTVENRTGRDVDLMLYLKLVDDKGATVGHAWVSEDDFRKGATRRFEALTVPGPPFAREFRLFENPPPYATVARGFAWDQRTLERMTACFNVIASCVDALHAQLGGGWGGEEAGNCGPHFRTRLAQVILPPRIACAR